MIGISPRQLQVFVHTAGSGSLRGAADALHLTQPAASMALAEMERQLGTPLFDREKNRLRLSARGRELLPLAQELLERYAELGRVAARKKAEPSGELRIGTSNTVGNYLVGDLLRDFVAAHPQVGIRLRVANTEDIARAVLEHQLDVGVVEGPVFQTELQVLPWRDDHLVVCAAPSHPLAHGKALKKSDFREQNWILREPGSATRTQSEQALAKLPPPARVLELSQTEAIKQAVAAGLGIACLPEVAIGEAVAAGRLAVLDTPFLDLRRKLTVLVRRGRYRGAALEAFLHGLKAATGGGGLQ